MFKTLQNILLFHIKYESDAIYFKGLRVFNLFSDDNLTLLSCYEATNMLKINLCIS